MVIKKTVRDDWIIVLPTGKILATFKTNEEAWRWLDRYQGEPISRQEDTANYVWNKIINGGAA